MSYYEHKEHDHVCESCGSPNINVRTYFSKESEETVYHCNSCGYIQWKDKFRG